ncbi:MAG TPA: hypothetical protein PLT64_10145 [Syntrophales bacterium]|nr:hypothetical protein [Syntrophales bacterium]HOL60207.1 hypothetical protein [Syntrophales bacterium]
MGGYLVVNVVLLFLGVAVLFWLRKKYRQISWTEMVVIIVLYAILVFLFTDEVVSGIKAFLEDSVL